MCVSNPTPEIRRPQIQEPLPPPTKVADDIGDPLKIRKRSKQNKKTFTKRRGGALRTALDNVGLSIPLPE